MKHVEVTNPAARLYFDRGYPGQRPDLTEADLIAAAARMGNIAIRTIIQVLDDDCMVLAHPDQVDVYCGLCHMPEELVTEYYRSLRSAQQLELDRFGVEWDPEIRL